MAGRQRASLEGPFDAEALQPRKSQQERYRRFSRSVHMGAQWEINQPRTPTYEALTNPREEKGNESVGAFIGARSWGLIQAIPQEANR